MNKQRTARINTIMSRVSQISKKDSNLCNNNEQFPNDIPGGEEITKNHEYYCLRDTEERPYCEKNEVEVDEDFSPDVFEYLPSPERLTNQRRLSQSSSSFGGDSDFLTSATQDIAKTPSTISNISLILNHVDFIASPSVIYESRQSSETKRIDSTICLQMTPSASNHYNTEILCIKRQRRLSRRCLNYTSFNEKVSDDQVSSSSATPINLQEVEQQGTFNSPTSIEVTVNKPYLVSQTESTDFDDTLKPENTSDSILIENTLINDINVTSNENDQNILNLSQLEDENNIIINYQSSNEAHHEENSMVVSNQGLQSLEHEIFATNIILNTQKNLTRKRSRLNESESKDQISKKRKNSGEIYIGCRSKKEFGKKTLKAACNCQKKCGDRITQEQREAIMQRYYRLGDHEQQWQFIANNTDTKDIKKMTLNRKNNRTQSIKYYFQIDSEKQQVCRTFFVNTLSISRQTVYTALEKAKRDGGSIDQRGHHDNRPRKMRIETEENIIKHIKLFPTVESHYVRKDSARQYLSELLNISKMYRLYQTWFQEGNYDFPMATKRQYETIFNTKFNYSFFKPKKDQCSTCTLYRQADPVVQATLQVKYDQHQKNKERVRQIKKEEKESVNPSNTTIAIFDLEKVLSIPQSQVGIFHYKRKYPIYNFTVFDAARRKGYCYVWHHMIAKRGAIEIGSCLWQFLLGEKERGIENVSFYSDGCGGQNKNRFIFALYTFAAQKLQMNITHRFFETGHGQSEGDSMHSSIERELKHRVVYTPDQMYAIIINAKINGEGYNVKEMSQSEFFDIKELIKNKNWVKDDEGLKIAWSKVMEVNVLYSQPSILRFKYDFDSEYSILNVHRNIEKNQRTPRSKRGTRYIATCASDFEPQLKVAYSRPLALRKALHSDLMSLCRTEAIPSFYHAFYNSLTFDNRPDGKTDDRDEEDEED